MNKRELRDLIIQWRTEYQETKNENARENFLELETEYLNRFGHHHSDYEYWKDVNPHERYKKADSGYGFAAKEWYETDLLEMEMMLGYGLEDSEAKVIFNRDLEIEKIALRGKGSRSQKDQLTTIAKQRFEEWKEGA